MQKRAPQPDPGLLTRSPTDPSRVAYVRGLFLERIRSYIGAGSAVGAGRSVLHSGAVNALCSGPVLCPGVPYARRHHQTEECTCEGCAEAGRQLALDPLFLDCCGLVRKVRARQHVCTDTCMHTPHDKPGYEPCNHACVICRLCETWPTCLAFDSALATKPTR